MNRSSRSPRSFLTSLFLVPMLVLILAAAVAPAPTLAAGTESAEAAPLPKTTLPEIEDEVMCPTCRTLLSLSASPAAQRQRVFIRKLIREGKTKDEIKDALVAEYGGQVLAEPEQDGINLWAYIVPTGLLLIAAVAVIGSILRRRRPSARQDEPGSDPEDAPGASPDDPDDDRLDRDMARFDL